MMVLRKNNVKEKKKVSFDSNVKILNMYAWKFAYQQARKSNWLFFAADNERFERRKRELETKLAEIGFFFSRK